MEKNLNPMYLTEWQNTASKKFGREASKLIAQAKDYVKQDNKHPIKSFIKSTFTKKGNETKQDALAKVMNAGNAMAKGKEAVGKNVEKFSLGRDDVTKLRGIAAKKSGINVNKVNDKDMRNGYYKYKRTRKHNIYG